MKTKLSFIFLLALLLGSCNPEQDSPFDGALVPAVFTPCFAGAPQVGSRAVNSAWTAGDAMGIYMLDGSNYTLSAALEANKKYSINNAATGTLAPADAAQTIYYPADGSSVRFVAYSPYTTAATGAGQATYSLTDQSTRAKQEAVDFIFYRGTTDRSTSNATETMAFNHRFCKINITVARATGALLSCEGLTLTLGGMPAAVTADLAALAADATQTGTTGLDAGTTAATITAYTSASAAANATIEAIVAPHAGTGSFTGRTLTFATGGNTFTYALPDNVTFESGKAYTFDFTLTKVAVLLNQSSIADWNTGSTQWDTDYYFGATATSVHRVAHHATSSQLTFVSEASTGMPMITLSTSATDRTAGAPAWMTGASFGTPTTTDGWTRRALTVQTEVNSGTARTAYLWITYQWLSCVITVTQEAKE